MKNNFLIGLGGSGGKIIANLYGRLLGELGPGFSNDVVGVAIDTDQDELNRLSQLGVRKICLSGNGTVGDYYNRLGDDVGTWCPNTENEGVFFGSDLFNGASQCRFKSRLCLASFLKDDNNELSDILEEALLAGNSNGATNAPPRILIASSIAGGTGSGIFIQVALYIKQFFLKRGIKPVIHGLFACPDLYADVVPQNDLPNIYANAYAVVRELNAMNLIAGDEVTAAYGGIIDINMEISTSCEGKLFEKSIEGRYGEKPYDIMYFIDKYNYLSRVRGGLDDYYKAMADIAYAHFYTEISGVVMTDESNEMDGHSIAPNAIYASSGAAEIKYPYADILKYIASRSIQDSFSTIWTKIDTDWKNYLAEKDAENKDRGMSAYIPEEGERATHFINTFNSLVKEDALEPTAFTFLAPMVKTDNKSRVDMYIASITAEATKRIAGDARIVAAKTQYKLDKLADRKQGVFQKIESYSKSGSNPQAVFQAITEIESKLADYFKDCMKYVLQESMTFANDIFTDNKDLWGYCDKSKIGIVNGLLYDSEKKEWVHPIAARYLLYSLSAKIRKRMEAIIGPVVDTPADDSEDFCAYFARKCEAHKKSLNRNKDESSLNNVEILCDIIDQFFYPKSKTKEVVVTYFNTLEKLVNNSDVDFAKALEHLAYLRVISRIDRFAEEYETFFDNIDDFMRKAGTTTTMFEMVHDDSNEAHYVCASAEIKKKMYEDVGRSLTSQTGDTASSISHALFTAMRENVASRKTAESSGVESSGTDLFFNRVMEIVAKSTETIPEVSAKINKNVFDAILYEYALTYPEFADDQTKYLKDEQAANRINEFIKRKLTILSNMSAPMLRYDARDPYSGMFNIETSAGVLEKPAVNDSYKYLSANIAVDQSVSDFCGKDSGRFYGEFAKYLPKDVDGQTVNIRYVNSKKIDKYTILCYTTVQCLQPYQIAAFDELKDGDYYKNYAERLITMETYKKYSLSPHLDKRWHKRGYLPYINVRKENESRLDLAKAFLFALCYAKVCYAYVGNDAKFAYGDAKNGTRYDVVYYNGESIPLNKVNRMMNWFADHEEIIAKYASQFDMYIDKEIAGLEERTGIVKDYKSAVTTEADILRQLRFKTIRPVEVLSARDGKTGKKREEENINSILQLAWDLHVSEEREVDKDYGELLIDVLCEIIKRYAKAPYNFQDIKNKVQGSESYMRYVETCEHIASIFLKYFAEDVGKAPIQDEVDISKEAPEQAKAEPSEETKEGTNVRKTADLTDGESLGDSVKKVVYGDAVENDKRFIWAKQQFYRFLTAEI